MAIVTCNYNIPGGARGSGGQLTGPGFGGNTPPLLNTGDWLHVVIKWSGPPPSAPSALTGYFVFSPAPLAATNQTVPSPFRLGNYYDCFSQQSAPQDSGSNPPSYTFKLKYNGGLPGKYELTFVAESGTNSPTVTQWSADPEFDTSS